MKHFNLTAIFSVVLIACGEMKKDSGFVNWPVYRGDDGVNASSSLNQINRENVKKMQVAWSYRTGDNIGNSTIECNPLIIDGILYGVSPGLKAFALAAATGKALWIFDPFQNRSGQSGVSRGLAYWTNGKEKRIFLCAAHMLISLDATTGRQIMEFGSDGFVDMRKGLRNDEEIEKYYIQNTSPSVIYEDLIIVGSSMGESYLDLPGSIRAYDVKSGAMKWIFNTVPLPGEYGFETWSKDSYKSIGGCNAWSGLSIDRKRGIVFAATGSPAFDFHGGLRKGDNLFANSVLAIDAATGKYIWHYQVSHHDLWDYDLPSPPNLVSIERGNKRIEAVAQITKQGWIFMLDRSTGTPLFRVEERAVPKSTMEDEFTSPTQPFPRWPDSLVRQGFDTTAITNISAESNNFVKKLVRKYRYGGIYTPPDTNGIIQLPGFRGGAEWSGAAVDSRTGIMYVGLNNIPNIVQLVELKGSDFAELMNMPLFKAGEIIFHNNCAPCHGADKKGNGPYPSLLNIASKMDRMEVKNILTTGRNKMPSFAHLNDTEQKALTSYLFDVRTPDGKIRGSVQVKLDSNIPSGRKYKINGYTQLKDQFGYPGSKPPWGSLKAVDLNTGEVLWQRPLGEYPELTKKGIPETGTQLFGGAIATAGGLLFIGASADEMFRAIDKETGKTLWEYKLPAGGYATPSTYQVNGKQYVVIGVGGGGFQATKSGDYYIAFSLPD